MGERVEEQGPEESKTNIWTEARTEPTGAGASSPETIIRMTSQLHMQ